MIHFIANYEVPNAKKSTIDELMNWLEDKQEITIDTETSKCGNSTIKMDIHDMSVIMFQIGDTKDQ